MKPRLAASVLVVWLSSVSIGLAGSARPILWRDNDDLPIAEPAEDPEGDYIWWDGVYNMAFYPLGKILDLGHLLHTLGEWTHVVGPREAADVNALDEVPDSAWFTNRHALHRLSADALARGPNLGPPPSAEGPLLILSGKELGMTPGFIVKDSKGNRYIVKLDPAKYPDLATGAEIVSSKIVYALGWNVPEYHLFTFDPSRLRIDKAAWIKNEFHQKRSMTDEDLRRILASAPHLTDGRIRAVASRYIPGVPKGPFRTLGVRSDDPNDTVPHEDRRELRGFRIVAALINFSDARRGNSYDAFVRPDDRKQGPGFLRHYFLDFNGTLGSGNDDWKDPSYGHEYVVDPPKLLLRVLTLGFWKPPWANLPLTHPALGYFESSTFDPEGWKPSYLNPLFDQATVRDSFWGAKLVASLTDADIAVIVHTGAWSDPRAEKLLAGILAERRRRIARAYFDSRRINPVDRFVIEESALRFDDLAVSSGVLDETVTRYRYRTPGGDWTVVTAPRVPLADTRSEAVIELETSHDGGAQWSPPAQVWLAPLDGVLQPVRVERTTR